MKTTIAKQPEQFRAVTIAVTCESQAELDALHRMARTARAKELQASGLNASNPVSYIERLELVNKGYGTVAGRGVTSTFLKLVSDAGGK